MTMVAGSRACEEHALPAASDVIERAAARASVRRFAAAPVPAELLARLVRGAQQSPSSDNLQAYSVIEVIDGAARHRLGAIAGGQAHVVQAPCFLVVCADLFRLATACELHGAVLDRESLELVLTAVVDATIFGANLAQLAEFAGLGSVMIGGIRNDVEAVAAVLALPPGCMGLFGLCLGWPAESPAPTPRLPREAVAHRDRYVVADAARHVRGYDAALRARRTELGKPVDHESAWSARAALKAARPARAGLGAALARLGFPNRFALPEDDPS